MMHDKVVPLWVKPDELKMLREHLCYAQTTRKATSTTLDKLIKQIDVYRPLGPDGKHGNLHTVKCGCKDK